MCTSYINIEGSCGQMIMRERTMEMYLYLFYLFLENFIFPYSLKFNKQDDPDKQGRCAFLKKWWNIWMAHGKANNNFNYNSPFNIELLLHCN